LKLAFGDDSLGSPASLAKRPYRRQGRFTALPVIGLLIATKTDITWLRDDQNGAEELESTGTGSLMIELEKRRSPSFKKSHKAGNWEGLLSWVRRQNMTLEQTILEKVRRSHLTNNRKFLTLLNLWCRNLRFSTKRQWSSNS